MATVPTWKHNRVANVFDWLDEVRTYERNVLSHRRG